MSPLAILGFLTVIIMLVLIMTKKASPLVALIVVPVVTPASSPVSLSRSYLRAPRRERRVL